MNAITRFAVTLFCVMLTLTAVCRAQNVPTEIKLTNGFVMHRCSVVSWSPDTITVAYVGGVVPIKIANIDPAQRPLFLAAVNDGMRKQQMHEQREASVARARADDAKATSEDNAQRQAEADAKREALERATFNHELMAGMTMEQVRQSKGGPTSTSEYRGASAFDYWTYTARGHGVDAWGNPKDLRLTFQDGLLVSWHED